MLLFSTEKTDDIPNPLTDLDKARLKAYMKTSLRIKSLANFGSDFRCSSHSGVAL
jgi:hypothetical protein